MTSFFNNVLKLVSGSFISQIIGILLIPFVTRLYLPADFGVFQIFVSLSSILVTFSCLSYQLAIMLPIEDEDSASIVILCFFLIGIVSITSEIIFIFFSDIIGKIINAPEISHFLIFLPLVIFLNGIFIVITYWQSRKKRFGSIATAQVANSVSSRTTQIGIGIYFASPVGLITGFIIGYIASVGVFVHQIIKDMHLFRAVTLKSIKNLAIRYKRFPIYTSWSTVSNTISMQLAPLLLGFFFDPIIVGYYAIANMVVFLPMGLIGSATSQVFFQKACDEKNQTGSVKNIVREIQHRLISIGMFPMFILIIIGGDLFSIVLGSQWYIAGEYAGILAPWIFFVFIASPLSAIFSVLERQTVDLSFNVLILLSRAVVLVIGGIYGNPWVALILYSITGVIFWAWMNFYLLKISGIPYKVGLNYYLKFFCIALVIALPLIIVKLMSLPIAILIIVAGIVSLIYYIYIVKNDLLLKNALIETIGGIKK